MSKDEAAQRAANAIEIFEEIKPKWKYAGTLGFDLMKQVNDDFAKGMNLIRAFESGIASKE
jgi:maltooligosyltrehalose synthase